MTSKLSDQFKTPAELGLTPGKFGERYAKTPGGKWVCFIPESNSETALIAVQDQPQTDQFDLIVDFDCEQSAVDLANALAALGGTYQVRDLSERIGGEIAPLMKVDKGHKSQPN